MVTDQTSFSLNFWVLVWISKYKNEKKTTSWRRIEFKNTSFLFNYNLEKLGFCLSNKEDYFKYLYYFLFYINALAFVSYLISIFKKSCKTRQTVNMVGVAVKHF